MPDPIVMPTPNIENLARYSVDRAGFQFRETACKRPAFAQAVIDELTSGAALGQYEPLSPEEEQYCLAWIDETQDEYLLPSGQVNDGRLIAAIRRELNDPNRISTMSG